MSALDGWAREYEAAFDAWEQTPRWRLLRRFVEKRIWKFCLRRMMECAEKEARENKAYWQRVCAERFWR